MDQSADGQTCIRDGAEEGEECPCARKGDDEIAGYCAVAPEGLAWMHRATDGGSSGRKLEATWGLFAFA